MIVSPTNPKEWQTMAGFLFALAGTHPSADMRMIGWVAEDDLKLVVGFNSWVGKTCQIHVAMKPGFTFTPKLMLKEVFRYAFEEAGRELLIGIVNSKNEDAMKFDLHLGFKEMWRLPGMHDDGGDIIVLGMKKTECRYLSSTIHLVAGHA